MAELKHGTRGGYVNHKCRCEKCREANRKWVREYAARRRAQGVERTIYTLTCQVCRQEFQGRYGASTCGGPGCKGKRAPLHGPARPPKGRPSMARLMAEGRWDEVVEKLLARTVQVGECMEWTGMMKDGYPLVGMGKTKTVATHRLMLQAKHGGRPLGVLHAHHVCANSRCVNPDHLVPATAAENAAEMLARQSYEARIRELEAVVREVAPDHEVLHRVPVSGAS